MIPTLKTERLVLRPHVMEDFPQYRDMMGSDHARYMGGPFEPRAAWDVFCQDVAGWHLFGHGALAVDLADGTPIGQVGVSAGPLFPEREIGWTAYPGHEGRGYMTEAARALREWAFANLSHDRLVSYIDPRNARSIALAERLGAVPDEAAPRQDPDDLVFVHPQPEARP
ncbi:MAG: GNAT family N-acetyltransferase [Pseudomonadota bacterium]